MMTNPNTAQVTYNGGSLAVQTANSGNIPIGSIGALNNFIDQTWYSPDWTYRPFPTYTVTSTVYRESKTDTAFKVVEKLMEKGHIKELSVKEFMALVKEIAATL